MRKHLCTKETGKKGFTLVEMMIVVAVIAILCAIGIPSIVTINRNLKFRQRNDYAESLFMAAQANLTELRSDGNLGALKTVSGSYELTEALRDKTGFPTADWSKQYAYTFQGEDAYDFILPPGCIDETVRNKNVLVEYNPSTGNVYSVFYTEDPEFDAIKRAYEDGKLHRDEAVRKNECKHGIYVGYYHGTGLSGAPLVVQRPDTLITADNGEEFMVTVSIQIPVEYLNTKPAFIKDLQVDLTVSGGEMTQAVRRAALGREPKLEEYSYMIRLKNANSSVGSDKIKGIRCGLSHDGLAVDITFPLDSLRDKGSFANHAYILKEDTPAAGKNLGHVTENGTRLHMADLDNGGKLRILPGDNITLTADSVFVNALSQPAVEIESGILSGVNPLYTYMVPSVSKKTADGQPQYIVGVSNGRHLQNLNIMHPAVAKQICDVMITDDIDWSITTNYYNTMYGKPVPGDAEKKPVYISGVTDAAAAEETMKETPGRSLPYFVPLQHRDLFGVVNFDGKDPGKAYPEIHGRDRDDNGQNKPSVEPGQKEAAKDERPGVEIRSLMINTSKYSSDNTFYATGNHPIGFKSAGLFSYLNARIDNVYVVNPKINMDGADFNSAAVGTLAGAVGCNAKVVNCASYLKLGTDFGRVKEYGVKGHGAVGGLVGYAESNRILPKDANGVTGSLKNDLDYLTFFRSFAAVPVHGHMTADKSTLSAKTEGVGGFVGHSFMANAYDCYASGNVDSDKTAIAVKAIDPKEKEAVAKELPKGVNVDTILSTRPFIYDGRRSVGAGGFVGTSQGARYTNCFATGSAYAITPNRDPVMRKDQKGYVNYKEQTSGVGSFVGVMCYDAQKTENTNTTTVDQWTIFENCYALGRAYAKDKALALFSGCNATKNLSPHDQLWSKGTFKGAKDMYMGDYHRVLAPYADANPGKTLEPTYGIWYIFKNSYQYNFSELPMGANTSSNECANFIGYKELKQIASKHNEAKSASDWKTQRINDVVKKFMGRSFDYDTLYFKDNSQMQDVYWKAMAGYPLNHWHEDVTVAMTHPYSSPLQGRRYPFPKIMEMDYYGNWPEEPRGSGLAYYEVYDVDPSGAAYKDPYGIYFDRDGAGKHTLKYKGEDCETADGTVIKASPIVKEDGYILISEANLGDSVAVSMGNVSSTAKIVKDQKGKVLKYAPGGVYGTTSFFVYKLPREIMEAADGTEFYSKLTTDAAAYYFNPNVALSQINPAADQKEPTKPGVVVNPAVNPEPDYPAMPPEILIRSARQFNALNTNQMKNFWDVYENIVPNYVQQLDVDGSRYEWNGEPAGNQILRVPPVGTDDRAFSGIYTGIQTSIKGFLPSNDTNYRNIGLFGTVGAQGKIRNLNVEVISAAPVTVGSGNADNLGILVGLNQGNLSNVHAVMASNAVASVKQLAAVYGKKDDDDGPWETWWDETYEDIFDDDNSSKLTDEIIQQVKDILSNVLDSLPKKIMKKFPKDISRNPDEWGGWETETEDDGTVKTEYDDDDFEDICEWLDKMGVGRDVVTPDLPTPKPGETTPAPIDILLQAANHVGGLVGVNHSVMSNCTVNAAPQANVTLKAKNAGGLIGFSGAAAADDKTTSVMFSDATYQGNLTMDVVTYAGGFVGHANKAGLISCKVSLGTQNNTSAYVSNAPVTGGFAGRLEDGSISNASVDLQCAVNGKDVLAGLAGQTVNFQVIRPAVSFHKDGSAVKASGLIDTTENCVISKATVNLEGTLNGSTYSAGMFGTIDTASSVKASKVNFELNGAVKSDNQAAGFAVETSGDVSESQVLMPAVLDQNKIADRISAGKNAAGFACSVKGGIVNRSSVSGQAKIYSQDRAAGFACEIVGSSLVDHCHVTPVQDTFDINETPSYLGNKLDNMAIRGEKQAAVFANVLSTPVDSVNYGIYGSYALGQLNGGSLAGFVNTNAGSIDDSMVNVAMKAGHVFAVNEGGTVTDCYGWYRDGDSQNPTKLTLPGDDQGYMSCFFADLDYQNRKEGMTDEQYKNVVNVLLVDNQCKVETSPDTDLIREKTLTDEQIAAGEKTTLQKLNREGDSPWKKGDFFGSYPFDRELDGQSYAYVMHSIHHGDWREPPFPSYGVVYYEVYNNDDLKPYDKPDAEGHTHYDPNLDNNVYWLHIKDAMDQKDNTMEGTPLDFTAYFGPDGKEIPGTRGLGKPVVVGKNGVVVPENHKDTPLVDFAGGKDEAEKAQNKAYLATIDMGHDLYKANYCLFSREIKKEGDIPFIPINIIMRDPETVCHFNKDLDKVHLNTSGSYRFYDLNPQEIETQLKDPKNVEKLITVGGKKTTVPLKFSIWFADTLAKREKNHYEIRSAEHLKHIEDTANTDGIADGIVTGVFEQSWDILNEDGSNKQFTPVKHFDGEYIAGDRKIVVENCDKSWIEDVPTYDPSRHDGKENNADREVFTGGLNLMIQNKVTKPIFAEATQKIHINSIEIGSIDCEYYAISNNASGGFYCDGDITVNGDVHGGLFGSVSGKGLRVHGITVKGKMHSNVFNLGRLVYSTTLGCEFDKNNNPINPGRIEIHRLSVAKLDCLLFGTVTPSLGDSGVFIDELMEFGEVGTKGSITGAPSCKYHIVPPQVHVMDCLNYNSKTQKYEPGKTSGVNNSASGLYPAGNGNIDLLPVPKVYMSVMNGPVFGSSVNQVISDQHFVIDTVNLNADNGKYVGVLANKIDAGIVRNCTIEVGEMNVYGDGTFGTIAGIAGEKADINNCTVTIGRINRIPGPDGAVCDTVIGGIVGENDGSKLTDNTVNDLNMVLSGAPNQKMTVGAVVGVNRGELTGNHAENMNITYVQPDPMGDVAEIGGLVGRNEGGLIKDTNDVSGEIILDKFVGMTLEEIPETTETTETTAAEEVIPSGKGRSYAVGGVVGTEIEDGKAVYENVTTSVAVDGNFADAKSEPAVNDPAGQGSVGMFAGYVTDGSFTNCSSTVKGNNKYHFLGEILCSTLTTDADAVSSDEKKESETVKGDLNAVANGYENAGSQTFNQYAAVLQSCSFIKGGTAYEQVIENGINFYSQSGAEEVIVYNASDVKAEAAVLESVAIQDLAREATNGQYGYTPYFALVNDEYLPLYVKMTRFGGEPVEMLDADAAETESTETDAATEPAEDTEPVTEPVSYVCELAYWSNGEYHSYGSVETEDIETAVWQDADHKIYSVNLNLEDGSYLIVNDQNEMLALDADLIDVSWNPMIKSMDLMEDRMIWNSYRNNDGTISWMNSADTCFLNKDLGAVSDEEFISIRVFADGSVRLGSANVKILLKKLVAVENDNPEFTNTFTYVGTSQVIGILAKDGTLTAPQQETTPENPTEAPAATEATEAAAPAETQAAAPAGTSAPVETAEAAQDTEITEEAPVVSDGTSAA